MTTLKLTNNQDITIKIDRQGHVTVTGKYVVAQRSEIKEDAPTNSMSAGAIAGGREGEQPPIKNKNSKGVIASMLRRKMKEQK